MSLALALLLPESILVLIPQHLQWQVILTIKGHAYIEDLAEQNECLVCLHADCAACTLLPDQVLSTILDFQFLLLFASFSNSSDEAYVLEHAVIAEYKALVTFRPNPILFKTVRHFNISKPSNYYNEAIQWPDTDVWHATMQQKMDSLYAQGVFRVAALSKSWKPIGIWWVFAHKLDADGQVIHGKEKVQLVAQGFSQCLEDYGSTYAPVAKLTNIRIMFAYAAKYDYHLFMFNIKTDFLNAPLFYKVYCKQVPGFPEADPLTCYHLLWALYGLKQSLHEWYTIFYQALKDLGLLNEHFEVVDSGPTTLYS